MAPPKDHPSEDPQKNTGAPADTPKSYEKVLDELKSVLANLNKPKTEDPREESSSLEEEFLRSPDMLNSPDDLESEQLGDASFPQGLDPSSTDSSSDADFWKGNVLGWPESPPENSQPPAPADPLITPQGFSPFQEDFSIPSPPVPPVSNPVNTDLPIERFSDFSDAKAAQPYDEVPALPVAPDEKSESVFDENQRTAFLGNLRVPIPGTLHQMSTPPTKKITDSTLEEMELNAKGHIQIACLYPDGQEAIAKEFMAQLKISAGKTAGCPEFVTVLTTPWFLKQVDLHSWKKAASLAGAHFMYVLAYKRDKDLFKDLAKIVHEDEVRARLVVLERINLKTLYADLLSDAMRNMNGKG